MKFKFIGENSYPFDNKTETSFETGQLSDVLMKFDDEVDLAYGIYDKKFDMSNIPNDTYPFNVNPHFQMSEK